MDRASQRQEARSRRDALPAPERKEKSLLIWKRLQELPAFREASQALFFASFQGEVDTAPMRQGSRDLGMDVAAPRPDPVAKRLVFYLLGDKEGLEAGPYGVPQPREDSDMVADLEVPSVVLVPGLAFDAAGNRLGYGGGYYDRFLAGEGRDLPKIGLAFDAQLLDQIQPQAHDVPVDFIVTESRTLHCAKARQR